MLEKQGTKTNLVTTSSTNNQEAAAKDQLILPT
jgi:hypothetical protein